MRHALRTLQAGSGAAMVEFAMVCPVFLFMALGIGDVASTVLAKFKTASATQSAVDLATQSINLQTSDMADIYAAAANVMAPFSSSGLVLRITNVASTGSNSAIVYWSCGQGSLPAWPAKMTVPMLPSGAPVSNMINLTSITYGGKTTSGANTSFIAVESTYSYTPPARFVIKSTQTMSGVAYTLPRQSAYVGFPWNGNINTPPNAPTATTSTASVTLSNGAVCNYMQ